MNIDDEFRNLCERLAIEWLGVNWRYLSAIVPQPPPRNAREECLDPLDGIVVSRGDFANFLVNQRLPALGIIRWFYRRGWLTNLAITTAGRQASYYVLQQPCIDAINAASDAFLQDDGKRGRPSSDSEYRDLVKRWHENKDILSVEHPSMAAFIAAERGVLIQTVKDKLKELGENLS